MYAFAPFSMIGMSSGLTRRVGDALTGLSFSMSNAAHTTPWSVFTNGLVSVQPHAT